MGLEKLKSLEQLEPLITREKAAGRRVVFTNGCFDLLHPGHIRYLRQAASLGNLLVVAVNSDASIGRLKGPARPIQPDRDRAEILCAMEMVDYVLIFEEDTPLRVIQALLPNVLVKGGDWGIDRIVGRAEVESAGGQVHSLPFAPGFSTSRIIDRIVGRPHPGQ